MARLVAPFALLILCSADPGPTECRNRNKKILSGKQCYDQDGNVCTAAVSFDPYNPKDPQGNGTNCSSIGDVCSCCGNTDEDCTGAGGSKGCICSKVEIPALKYWARCYGCDQSRAIAAKGSDPVYPPGKITVDFQVEASTSCTANAAAGKVYPVSTWANGVAGYDGGYSIYGADDMTAWDPKVGLPTHEWSKTLTSGTYKLNGKSPLMYICAFSPSENSYPLPPPIKDWHMCGCCYQLNAQNATWFGGLCQDSSGVCENMCQVTTSGTQSDRHYKIVLGNKNATVLV